MANEKREMENGEWQIPAFCCAWCLLIHRVVVLDLGDGGKWNLNDLAAGAFDLHARRGQRLRGFHTAHSAAHALAIEGYDLNVVFSVERLQRRQRFCYFHFCCFSLRS